jgi:DNA polymerase-4
MTRWIVHLDMDSYFASVEQQAQPSLRGKPIGVTGKPTERTIVTAFSREAKRYPVTTAMPVWEARKRCPNLLLVPGHPERYVETSRRFLEILKEYTAMIEVYSIDEVFMDVTQEAARRGGPVAMAHDIQRRFHDALGPCITATLGIAPAGKVFAKLIGKRNKPNGVGLLRDEELPTLLRTTSVGDVCGIGPRIERRLHQLGILTLADLGTASDTLLRREFGVYGLFLRQIGLGRDPTPVVPYTEIPPPKSVGHSKTLPPEMRDVSLALLVLRDLADHVAARLRRLGYVGRTIHCGFRTGVLGPGYAKQATLAIPSDDGETIYRACRSILEAIPVHPAEIALVSVSAANLLERSALPDVLFEEDRRRDRLNGAVDVIRTRYGDSAIRLGTSLLLKPLPQHVGGFIQETWDFGPARGVG